MWFTSNTSLSWIRFTSTNDSDCLVYLYSKLVEGYFLKTKQMKPSCTLLTVIYLHPLLFMNQFHNTCITPVLIIHMYPFQAWILQYFPRISSYSYVDGFTEYMPCACAFILLRGNHLMKPFRVYLDCTVHDSICFPTVRPSPSDASLG